MQLTVDNVDRIYSSYSHLYDRLFGWVFRPRVQRMIEELKIQPGERVLELGFGTGMSLPFYPPGCEVVGIDICGSMLQEVRAKREQHPELGYDLSIAEMDATRLAFADESFDVVVGCFMATVVDDPVRLVEEMLRVKKPGGRAALVNHFQSERWVVGPLVRLCNPVTRRLGWRTDLTLSWLVANSPMQVERRFKNNRICPDLFTFVFFDGPRAATALGSVTDSGYTPTSCTG